MGREPVDWIHRLGQLAKPLVPVCEVPADLTGLVSIGEEAPALAAGVPDEDVDALWRAVEALYRSGVYPALQLCIRREGQVVLDRSLGHARGNAPDDAADASKPLATTETRFNIFSASKAVAAMVIHKLDEQRVLHVADRVCDFIPQFAIHGKQEVTISHILGHRAGIPSLPPGALNLDYLAEPDKLVEMLCHAKPNSQAGRQLAYHAISGGFILAEIVKRASGQSIREIFDKEIAQPLGLVRTSFGVAPVDVESVAVNAFTGPPAPPPLSGVLQTALGVELREAVELSNDPRFLTSIIASANVVSSARELSRFYDCLLCEGELDGVRVLEPRTVRHATSEQSYGAIDRTLGMPVRYGLGFMLGSDGASPFGWNNPQAFGHVGFTNVLSWADPQRQLSVALLTSGKPVMSAHAIRLVQLLAEIQRVFPKICGPGTGRRRFARL